MYLKLYKNLLKDTNRKFAIQKSAVTLIRNLRNGCLRFEVAHAHARLSDDIIQVRQCYNELMDVLNAEGYVMIVVCSSLPFLPL